MEEDNKMANAWVYMFIVGSGAATGVAVVGLVTFLLLKKITAGSTGKKKSKKGVIR